MFHRFQRSLVTFLIYPALNFGGRAARSGGAGLGLPSGLLSFPLLLHMLDVTFGFLSVHCLDGYETMRDSAKRILPGLIEQAGFTAVEENRRDRTLYGTHSIYGSLRPQAQSESTIIFS
jgi:hypothetical protein